MHYNGIRNIDQVGCTRTREVFIFKLRDVRHFVELITLSLGFNDYYDQIVKKGNESKIKLKVQWYSFPYSCNNFVLTVMFGLSYVL